MPFPFCLLIFSYAIRQASIERAFELNPVEVQQ
jgi:hypothetical protein